MSYDQGGAGKTNLRTPIPGTFAQALAFFQSGRLPEAEQLCRNILAAQPRHADSLHLLGLIARKAGHNDIGTDLIRQAIGVNAGVAAFHFNLGLALTDQEKPDEAAASYRQAIALKPDYLRAYINLGNVLQDQEKFADAATAFRDAIACKPDVPTAHNNLGNALRKMGDAGEAMACYRRALALEPGFAIAHYNLGNALKERGETDQAIASYTHALAASPNFAEAHFNLARALKEQGNLADAEMSLRRGLALKPDSSDELSDLASTLMLQGRLMEAFEAIGQSLGIRETDSAKRVFVSCIKNAEWKSNSGELQNLIIRALTEPWCHPSDLAQTCAGFLKHDPQIGPAIARATEAWPAPLSADMLLGPDGAAALAENPLLEALLCIAPNADMQMEHFLTMARGLLLEAAMADMTPSGPALRFYSALARQCFINEYVFYAAEKEVANARTLLGSVTEALHANRAVPALQLLAVASYFPLYSLPLASRLLKETWPESVQAVLAQQIEQPLEEKRLRAEIPSLTNIEDATSKRVQDQYEENPYPRWVKTAPVEAVGSLAGYLHRKFPLTVPQRPGEKRLDVLIAGCGTGQHSIETARSFPDARILAIDLSANSLGYARYKTQELGLTAIEYAQADIMALGELDRRFDLIESVGVLHHLGDTFAGWRVLLSLLAPGSFMRLALYSQTARENITKARAFVAERGYGASADDIRQARQDIAAWDDRAAAEAILNSSDFFSASNCRDLIFHAQEQCMTLPGIAAFLKENGVAFLGFDLSSDVMDAYRRRFPHDPAAIDLGQWEIFESENPSIFAGMYHFWIRKLS